MLHKKMQTIKIGIEGIESVPGNEIHERVMRGEVIVIRQFLQELDYFEKFQQASLEGICQVVGQEKALQVKEKGFEAIHEIIDIDELTSIVDSTYEAFRPLASEFAKKLVKEIFQTNKPFYYEESPNMRFHVPFDVVMKKREELSQFRWNGKITAHGPHHDSWYYCPTNCFNVWIAIGAVKPGNGLTVFPKAYGKRLPCTKDGKILHNQYYGEAINFDLEPGDAVIFHGEHLHSSEINSTNITRYVASWRMTLGKPNFIGASPYKENYIYAESDNRLKVKFNQMTANISRLLEKRIKSFLNKGKTVSYVISPSEMDAFDDTSNDFPQPLELKLVEGKLQNPEKLVFDSQELPVGAIKPISQKLCVARLDKQRVAVFSRRCPHEGADLAAGHLRDGCVVCPWHNLQFDLQSGASPCLSLPELSVSEYVQNNEQDEWQISHTNQGVIS